MTDDYQLRSWCDPYGHRQVAGLVGQLYFPTDIAVLDSQDLAELSKLQRPFSVLLIGRRVHFWCVGHADHRFRWNHNKELAGRRANSVKEILDQLFRDMRFYSGAALTSRGEMEANFPAPSSQQMASDRRVDLFSSTLPNRPPIELPMLQIVGRFPPENRDS